MQKCLAFWKIAFLPRLLLIIGNRTEWSSIWTTAQRESDLFITSIITDRIGRHLVLFPIYHKIAISEKRGIAKL